MSGRVDQRFGMVPLWLLKSGASDRAIAFYAWLAAEFVDGSEARTDEGVDWFAEASGRSEPTVKRAFAELEKLGAVTRVRRLGLPSSTQIHRSDPISRSAQKSAGVQIQFDPVIPTGKDRQKTKDGDSQEGSDQNSDPSKTSSSPSAEGETKVSSAREVFDYWQQVMDKPRAKFTPERSKKISARLAEGYSAEDLKRAIDGCAASDFHMGRDPMNDVTAGGKRYDTIGLIFRNGEKLEDFMATAPVKKTYTAEQLLEERKYFHPEVEVPDMRDEGTWPFDAESDRIMRESGLEG
jgi:uncharacterized phage protein (TIGR02220 family)